jgi:hypothetical protein
MASRVFVSEKSSERLMYPWSTGEFDNAMDVALDIAMNYLDRTGQAVMFKEVQWKAAMAILTAWKGGMRHPIKLADIAIKAVERKRTCFWNIKGDQGPSGNQI